MVASLGNSTMQLLTESMRNSQSRADFWVHFIHLARVQRMVEIGVYRGDFAAAVLGRCDCVRKYYMLDPWRYLDDWNKPANQDNAAFERFFQEATAKTDFANSRRVILRGKTSEVINQVPDGELDLAYIDGDHTLRGITIDLIRVYPKIRMGGFVGGDDFTQSIWQHNVSFEPTLVFPFAVYFAEAVGATIYALPNSQFCLHKTGQSEFNFVDVTGHYGDRSLKQQCTTKNMLKRALEDELPGVTRAARKLRDWITR
jgi:Methyltransferase domain